MYMYNVGPYTFSVGDTRAFGEFKKGGSAIQCKIAKTMKFVSFDHPIAIFIHDAFSETEIIKAIFR